MSASYERGKADPAAPWKWRFDYGRLRIETNDGAGVCYADTERDADYLCKTAHEAQVMRAVCAEYIAAIDADDVNLQTDAGALSNKRMLGIRRLGKAREAMDAALAEFPK